MLYILSFYIGFVSPGFNNNLHYLYDTAFVPTNKNQLMTLFLVRDIIRVKVYSKPLSLPEAIEDFESQTSDTDSVTYTGSKENASRRKEQGREDTGSPDCKHC